MLAVGDQRVRARWCALAWLFATVIVPTSAPAQPLAGGEAKASKPSPQAYLADALTILQDRDVFTRRVDWPVERRRLLSMLAQRPSLSLSRELIQQALTDLNDGHGRLIPPSEAPTSSSPGAPVVPHGRMLPGHVGYLLLPAVSASPDSPAAAAYADRGQQLVQSLSRGGAARWVVDLRWNSGGDLYPMLVAIGGLLTKGRVMGFQPVSGPRTWITYDGRGFFAEGVKIMPALRPEPTIRRYSRIAILTSSQTASSGEAIIISFRGQHAIRTFGQPTFGVPNAPTVVRLNDGYELEYSAEADVDRTGRVYNGPLSPDELVAVPKTLASTDLEMRAAMKWLRPASRLRRSIFETLATVGVLMVGVGLVGAGWRRRRMSD